MKGDIMENKQQQQKSDGLFQGIGMENFEENLITVDIPKEEEEKLATEVETIKPEKTAEQIAAEAGTSTTDKPTEKEDKEKEDESITVDTKPEEELTAEEKLAKEKKDAGSVPGKEGSESPVYLHAATLQERGILPNFDLETIKKLEPKEAIDKVNEHIDQQIKDAIKLGVETWKNSFSPKAKKFLDDIDKGVPLEALQENVTIEDHYSRISEKDLIDNEDLQKSVYSDLLSYRGFSSQKINKLIEKATQDGDLADEAKEGLVEIKGIIADEKTTMENNAVEDKRIRDKTNQEMKEKISASVKEVKEIVPGIPFGDKEKSVVENMMTVPVRYESRNGEEVPVSAAMDLRAKDPIAFEMKLNYFIKNGFFDKDKKLDKFIKKAETSAAQKLIDKMSDDKDKHESGKTTIVTAKTEDKDGVFVYPDNM